MKTQDYFLRNAEIVVPAMHRYMLNQLRFFPYRREVILWFELHEALEDNALLEEQVDSLIEERNNLKERLLLFGCAEGLLTLDQLDGGDCLREINDHLQEMAHDIHNRGHVTKDRKIVVTVLGAPGKESARVDLDYDVEIKKPKSSGRGIGYLDAKGNLVPAHTDAEQIMLPVEADTKAAA